MWGIVLVISTMPHFITTHSINNPNYIKMQQNKNQQLDAKFRKFIKVLIMAQIRNFGFVPPFSESSIRKALPKKRKRRLYTMPSRENRHATRLRPLVPTVSNARKSAAPERARNRPPTTRRTTARTRMPDPNRRRTSPSTRRGCKIEKTASARRIPAHKRPRPLPKIRYCALLP